jgi:hypothetical protein
LEEINNYNYFLPSGQAIPQQFSHYFYWKELWPKLNGKIFKWWGVVTGRTTEI